MAKLIKSLIYSVVAVILLNNAVYASVQCSEKVLRTIVHKNGSVYFSTDKTCADMWCKIDFEDPKQIDRAYSMLLSATVADKSVAFVWPNISTCDEKNSNQASPDYLDVRP
ncbi:hypothetical protein [Microbulbifer sp. TRSA005]|uniref:hypothetical protein n=1 Tax=unclassified Microbulbifer TaxID=2619833 RepID=UPI00403A3D88